MLPFRQQMTAPRVVALGCLMFGSLIGYFVRELNWPPVSLAQQPPGQGYFSQGSSRNSAPPSGNGPIEPKTIAPGISTRTNPRVEMMPADGMTQEEIVNTSVFENCNRSVVHITTHATRVESFLTASIREGTGSGSIIDQQGHVLTNNHVIEGAKEISVRLFNGMSYPAVIWGQDPDTDIAVLKVDAPTQELFPIQWGDSQNLKVGQRIFAIGNPFGLERTMSTGIISCVNRQIPSGKNRPMRSLIQIDAALNQGNSGGPLINTRSELIGMNTAIMSTSGDNAGVGFAIPVSTLRRIVPQLIQHHKFVRPTIGIERVYENNGKLLIVIVVPGGPADKAGLKGFSLKKQTTRQGLLRFDQTVVDPSTADQILMVDGKAVNNADELLAVIEEKHPGDVVEVIVDRAGKQFATRVTLGAGD